MPVHSNEMPSNITQVPEEDQSLTMSSAEDDSGQTMAALQQDYDTTIRPKMDLIDQLRMDGLNADVPLPQIVVIGDQSAGKSSTLEALSGIQLPRGSTLTTRVPLAMVLRRSAGSEKEGHSCTLTYHNRADGREVCDNIEEEDMENLQNRILKAQDAVRGHDAISDRAITLCISKPNAPDLSLVDLPGIARMVKGLGQEGFDIAERTIGLIKKFVESLDTIILVVLPCNVDVATCEAMKLAREVDPHGERTLGVLTKADLVNEGTESDIMDIANNREWKLKKGYTLIRCRTHKEMLENITLEEALEREEQFFQKHSVFRTLPSSRKGVTSLSQTLTRELAEHIKKRLPEIRKSVVEALKETKKSLDSLGVDIPQEATGKRLMLAQICQKFADDIKGLTSGEYQGKICLQKGGLRTSMHPELRKMFENFNQQIWKLKPVENSKTLAEIEEIRKQQRGWELPTFIKYNGCQAYIRDLLEQCRPAADELLEKASERIEQHLVQVVILHFSSFSGLEEKIMMLVNDSREEATRAASDVIMELFQMEALVHTADAFFYAEEQNLRPKEAEKISVSEVKDIPPAVQDARSMLKSIQAYFNIAYRRLSDMVPMVVLRHLVQRLCDNIQEQVLVLPSEAANLDFLQEDKQKLELRHELEEKVERLSKARARLATL